MKNMGLHKKNLQLAAILFSVFLLVIAWFTIHDMQRAEGIGLYYVLNTGTGIGISGMGMVVECVGLLTMLVFLLIPCFAFRRINPESFLRIFIAYLAFMPSISMGYLVHLQNGTEAVQFSEALQAGNLWSAFRQGTSGIAPLLSTGVPLLVLMTAISEKGKKRTPRLIMLTVQILLLATAILFPALEDICNYFFRYLLLVYGFSLWEHLFEVWPQYKNWGWLIFGILGMRGVYIMAELMSVYHV